MRSKVPELLGQILVYRVRYAMRTFDMCPA